MVARVTTTGGSHCRQAHAASSMARGLALTISIGDVSSRVAMMVYGSPRIAAAYSVSDWSLESGSSTVTVGRRTARSAGDSTGRSFRSDVHFSETSGKSFEYHI